MKLKTETNDKDEFMCTLDHGTWIITTDNKLLSMPEHMTYDDLGLNEEEVKEELWLYMHNDTYWLELFCDEYHPEIDFHKEFETNEPGVFARYQAKFGYDYAEWEYQQKYNELKNELAKRGYELPWE